MDAGNSSAGRSSSSNRTLCRYFASNVCNRGDLCSFSHERNARPNMTCTYYLAGNCAYGSACRYDHVRPREVPTTSASSIQPSVPRVVRNLASVNAEQQSSKKKEKKTLPTETEIETSSSQPTESAWSKPLSYVSNLREEPFTMSSLFDELELIEARELGGNFTTRRQDHATPADIPLCPYHEVGCCMNGDACTFVHGDTCDMCDANCLHPFNETQRIEHHRACLSNHEAAMEAAFAEARSLDKQCGICMEMIVEKQLRFGILESCKHCYCLTCIRKWRQRSTEFTSKIIRSCPECRVVSDYVIPSTTWVEDPTEKDKLISIYRENMKQKECKYTKRGTVDDCPFGNKCFYRHLFSDGTPAEGESPRDLQKRRRMLADLHRELIDDDDEEDLMGEVIQALAVNRRRHN